MESRSGNTGGPDADNTAKDLAGALEQDSQRPKLRFEPALEEDFRAHYWRRYLPRTRYSLTVGALIFAIFAYKDYSSLPAAVWQYTVALRLGVIVPAIAVILLFSLAPRTQRYLEPLLALGVFLAFGGLSAAMLVAHALGSALPYEGLMLVIAFVYFLSGLRTRKAAATALLSTAGFIAASAWAGVPQATTVLRAYYLLTLNAIGIIGALSHETALRAGFLAQRLAEQRAVSDLLTGLPNRRGALEHIGRAWRAAERERLSVGVILLDVDHFKRFNDTYGHPAGDACLKRLATALATELHRPLDIAARYGGEEFIALAYGIEPAALPPFCEKLRLAVRTLDIPHEGSPDHGVVTISIGAASLLPTARLGIEAAIAAADQALYRAKSGGRDRCEVVAV